MTLYTFRLLGPDGAPCEELQQHHGSDDEAIDGVEGLGHADGVQVWDAERLVADFPADRRPRPFQAAISAQARGPKRPG